MKETHNAETLSIGFDCNLDRVRQVRVLEDDDLVSSLLCLIAHMVAVFDQLITRPVSKKDRPVPIWLSVP